MNEKTLMCKSYIPGEFPGLEEDVLEAISSGPDHSGEGGTYRVIVQYLPTDYCNCTWDHSDSCKNHWSKQPDAKDRIPF